MSETDKNKGGRPKTTETPEFKAAVDTAVQAAMAKFAEQLASARQSAGTGGTPAVTGDQEFTRLLALSIAELTDQGTDRKRVAPEILAKRADARERMGALIMKARAEGTKPEYRLINEVYLNERLLKPFIMGPDKRPVPQEIIWTGAPNEAMRPVNQVAKDIWEAFMESIGGSTESIKGSENRPMWVTAGGLVVKGVAPGQRRAVSGLGDPLPDFAFSDDLEAKRPNDPTAEYVHVLGTVAPPARQNFAGAK